MATHDVQALCCRTWFLTSFEGRNSSLNLDDVGWEQHSRRQSLCFLSEAGFLLLIIWSMLQ